MLHGIRLDNKFHFFEISGGSDKTDIEQRIKGNFTEYCFEHMILDITDYVMQYMPNYRAYFERHPEYAGRETMLVNGERRYLCLYQLDEVTPEAWGGMVYRRDWIVKYGKDADGNSFSGEWGEDGNWTDNVVFPSGEVFPKYVSD